MPPWLPWIDLYASVLLLGALAESGLAVLAWRRRPTRGAAALSALLVATVIWSAAYALSLLAVDRGLQLFWERVQFIGVCAVPVSWFRFVVDTLGIRRWRTRLATLALATPGTLALLAVAVDRGDGHGPFWSGFGQVVVGGRLILEPRFGLGFWAFAFYAFVLIVAGTGLVATNSSLARSSFRGQRSALLVAPFLPALLQLGFLAGVGGLAPLRFAPLALGISAVLVWRAILRERLLDLVPIAWERVVEELGHGVAVLDHNRRIVELNPAMGLFLGLSERDAVGRPLAQAVPALESLLQEQGPLVRRLEFERAGRAVPAEVDLWPLHSTGPDGDGLLVVVRDLTERERARAMEVAVAADRAKGRFLATISHEIRTPMTAILGMSEILLDTALDDEQRDLAQRVQAASLNLLSLLEDILDVSRIDSGTLVLQPRPTALRDTVAAALDLFRPAADGKGLVLRSDVATDVPGLVLVDPDRLRQILVNLLSNAIKYTEAGHVEIRAFVAEHEAGKPGTLLRLEVEDTGIGIRPQDQAVLFEAFFQAASGRTIGGAGLGLAIVKRLVEQMGGEIGVWSECGRGSTFWLTLRTGAGGVPE